jgi:hypothetical protein
LQSAAQDLAEWLMVDAEELVGERLGLADSRPQMDLHASFMILKYDEDARQRVVHDHRDAGGKVAQALTSHIIQRIVAGGQQEGLAAKR